MKFRIVWLILGLVMSSEVSFPVHSGFAQRTRKEVPVGFSYPQSPDTIEIERPFSARSLHGIISDSNKTVLEDALVERLEARSGRRVYAVFTDSNGAFAIPSGPGNVQSLKISKAGYNTLLIKVVIKKSGKSQLFLYMGPSR